MILKQHRIYRSDLQNNPEVLYLFGDNRTRTGLGGQAKEMRGEPNAVGVVTKWEPAMRPASFFTDADYDKVTYLITLDLGPVRKHLREGGVVVIPSDGLGTGLSELPKRAPLIHKFLEKSLKELETL